MQQKDYACSQQPSKDYKTIEKALESMHEIRPEQVSLPQMSQAFNLTESSVQKLFSRWGRVSPEQFLQFLTKEYAKQLLTNSENILNTTNDSGLSSPARLHDLIIHSEHVAPDKYPQKGAGLKIIYGFTESPFGACLIAKTHYGICHLKFVRHHTRSQITQWLEQQWPRADFKMNNKDIQYLSSIVFPQDLNPVKEPLHLYIQGTRFQIKVWEALTRIPFGYAVSYQDLAEFVKSPGAARAVGTAVGKNPVPFLIPCHRVIRKMGVFGEYGEGDIRKKIMLGWEASLLYLSRNASGFARISDQTTAFFN